MELPETSLQSIFDEAIQLTAVEERAAFIKQACAGDDSLQRRVTELVETFCTADGLHFLEHDKPREKPTVGWQTCTRVEHAVSGEQIDRFQLIRELGEGGFGVVWLAEQLEPVRRQVALKIIKRGMDTKEVIARFDAERQALAMMDHPHIATVYDAGATASGLPYFVMELVEGAPVTEFCVRHQLTLEQRLNLFVQICEAVQHAHQKGIIHRDIKPSNIMVVMRGDKPTPKVIDFGIAKAMEHSLTDKTLVTQDHHLIGTPAYMSPEQATLGGGNADTRSDVYSLGALLYELLTGVTPVDAQRLKASSPEEVRRILLEEEPKRPSTCISSLGSRDLLRTHPPYVADRLARRVKGDLDWVVLKALAKEQDRRYQSAQDLGNDVRRFLRSEPVSAVAPTAAYLMKRFARRHRAALAVASIIAIILVGSASFSSWKAIQATEARKQSEENFALAQQERNAAKLQLSQSDLALADHWLAQNRVPRALAYMARSLRNDPTNQAVLRRLMSTLAHRHLALPGEQMVRLEMDGAHSYFNADGTQLVVIAPDLSLNFHDLVSGDAVRGATTLTKIETGIEVHFVDNDSKVVTVETDGGRVHVWDTHTGDLIGTPIEHPPAVRTIAISARDRQIITAGADSKLRFWSLDTGEEAHDSLTLGLPQVELGLAADGGKLLTNVAFETDIEIWDLHPTAPPQRSRNQIRFLSGGYHHSFLKAIKPDKVTLITSSARGLQCWNTLTGESVWRADYEDGLATNLAWSRDGTRFVIQGSSGNLEARNALTGHLIRQIPVTGLSSFRIGSDGQSIIGVTLPNNQVSIWDLESGSFVVPSHERHGRGSAWSVLPGSRGFVYHDGGEKGGVARYHYDGGAALAYEFLPEINERFADISADWRQSLWINQAGAVFGVDNRTKQASGPVIEETARIHEARFNPTGDTIATLSGRARRTLSRWRLGESPKRLSSYTFDESGVIRKWVTDSSQTKFAFVIDQPGEKILAGEKQLLLWNSRESDTPLVLDRFNGLYADINISTDGRRVIMLERRSGGCHLFEEHQGQWQSHYPQSSYTFTGGDFSHDGRWLILVSPESGAQCYDLAAREWVDRFSGRLNFEKIMWAQFSLDGRWLLFGSGKAIVVWDWQMNQMASDRIRVNDLVGGLDAPHEALLLRQGRLSPAGDRLLWRERSRPMISDIAPSSDAPPDWLYEFVERYSGLHFDDDGDLTSSPSSFERFQQLREAAHENEAEDGIDRWRGWLVANRTTRAVSPSAPITWQEHIDNLVDSNDASRIEKAWELSPFDARTMARMASLFLDRQDPASQQRGRWLMEQAAHTDPSEPDLHFVRAAIERNSGRPTEAVRAIETAIEMKPGASEYHQFHGILLTELNRPEEALIAYDKAMNAMVERAEYHTRGKRDRLRFFKIGLLREIGGHDEVKQVERELYTIPLRDPAADRQQIDLTKHFNAGLEQSWNGEDNGSFADMPVGLVEFGGITFDVRGLIQLLSNVMLGESQMLLSGGEGHLKNQYPSRVNEIPIQQTADRLHFLHASLYGNSYFAPKGTLVGYYDLHYANGETRRIELKLGEELRDWWISNSLRNPAFAPEKELELVWRGSHEQSNSGLYKTTWENPLPTVPIAHLDFVSALNEPAPFLVAITLE